MGFAPSKSDSSLFVRQGHNRPVSRLLYVDYLVIAIDDPEEIGGMKFQLVASLEMKNLGNLHYLRGIEVIRTPESIYIDQPTPFCDEYVVQVRHD